MATPTSLPSTFSAGAVLTAAQMNNMRGAFRVLQVVQGTTGTEVANNTSTYVDTGLSATITPSATTSKVLILVNQTACYKSGDNVGNGLNLLLVYGANINVQLFGYFALYTGSLIQNRGNVDGIFLHSPSTTSAITYKTRFMNTNNGAAVAVQAGSVTTSTITLLEISA